jgi:hypothetical protein
MDLARGEIRLRTQRDERLLEFEEWVLNGLKGKMDDGSMGLLVDPHICCLTLDDNTFSDKHWREYASKGTGVALAS